VGRVEGARYAEVGELRAPVLVHEDVLRLYVAVDDAPLVGVGETVGDGCPDARQHRARERSPPVDEPLEVAAGYVLDDYVGGLSPSQHVLARVVDLHDVGVGETGGGASLAPEAGAHVRALEVGAQDLHGHRPVKDLVAPEEDGGHTARADLAHEHEPPAEKVHVHPPGNAAETR
jgi:hypothetical protein